MQLDSQRGRIHDRRMRGLGERVDDDDAGVDDASVW